VDEIAGFLIHDSPAAGRQHLRPVIQQPRNHAHFAGAKIALAVLVEDFRDGHAGGAFDFGVGIDKRNPQPGGEPAADRRLAGAHHADQHDSAPPKRADDRSFQPVFRRLLNDTVRHARVPTQHSGSIYQNRDSRAGGR
jgi:hypothetical protein